MATQTKYQGDVHSSVNQNICGKLVDRQVYMNVGGIVEYIIAKSNEGDRNAPFSFDDIENLTGPERVKEHQFRYCINLDERGEFSAGFYAIDEDGDDGTCILFIDTEEAQFLSDEGVDVHDGDEILAYYFDLNEPDYKAMFGCRYLDLTVLGEYGDVEMEEGEDQEALEWWAVSSWLYRKLREMGEIVLDAGDFYVWGRQTSGQAIKLDSTFSELAIDMEILEGQKNQWNP